MRLLLLLLLLCITASRVQAGWFFWSSPTPTQPTQPPDNNDQQILLPNAVVDNKQESGQNNVNVAGQLPAIKSFPDSNLNNADTGPKQQTGNNDQQKQLPTDSEQKSLPESNLNNKDTGPEGQIENDDQQKQLPTDSEQKSLPESNLDNKDAGPKEQIENDDQQEQQEQQEQLPTQNKLPESNLNNGDDQPHPSTVAVEHSSSKAKDECLAAVEDRFFDIVKPGGMLSKFAASMGVSKKQLRKTLNSPTDLKSVVASIVQGQPPMLRSMAESFLCSEKVRSVDVDYLNNKCSSIDHAKPIKCSLLGSHSRLRHNSRNKL